jgi:1,2-dihydroxy-3-keto-5-methylthiopentene dioxygenase
VPQASVLACLDRGRPAVTTFILYEDSGRGAPLDATDNFAVIKAKLKELGVGFEQQDASLPLPSDADAELVLRTYAEVVARLRAKHGFQSVDVFRLLPSSPGRHEARRTFLSEHTHSDDEVRFFVEGGGTFFLRAGDKVVELRVERGDLISVPAGARHWFDCGDPPYCTAIRLFTRPDGWIGTFTGDTIVSRFVPTPP